MFHFHISMFHFQLKLTFFEQKFYELETIGSQ